MTTLAKIKSNRRNAMRSTGPKTKMGKAISSKNALRHGLLSRAALLPDEDPEAFADLQRGIEADLDPAGEIECRLVDRVTMAIWRLARAQRVEASVFAHRMADQRAHLAASDARSCESYVLTEVLAKPNREITDPERRESSLERAQAAGAERDGEVLGGAFIADAESSNALSKLSRYETAHERSLSRALHELQRLQAARAGQVVSLPAVLDIDISTDQE